MTEQLNNNKYFQLYSPVLKLMKILKLSVELVLHGFYTTTKLAEINLCIFTLSPPGSSVHGVLQARVLEWGDIAFSDAHVRRLK